MTPRALVLDLDDTLYPERRFALSGYAAVARWLHATQGTPADTVFAGLVRALRTGRRATAFQDVCRSVQLDGALLPEMLRVYRHHEPRLRLSDSTLQMLVQARRSWRVGLLTNGLPGIQARKIAALRLESLIDVIVLAEEHGTGVGKPDPAAFEVVLERLGVEPGAAVFAGDDPVRDVAGARNVGMKTIRVRRVGVRVGTAVPEGEAEADAVVTAAREIPAAAESLLSGGGEHVH